MSNHRPNGDPKNQKSGSLEFLDNKGAKIFEIKLLDVGIFKLSTMSSTANSDQIKRDKFELYVGSMDIDGTGGLGIE